MGSTLRVRGRKFPAVINCTCIDWFHEWPQEALISVSMRFLNELDVVPELIKPSISQVWHVVLSDPVDSREHTYVLPRARNANPFGFSKAISGLIKLVSGLN